MYVYCVYLYVFISTHTHIYIYIYILYINIFIFFLNIFTHILSKHKLVLWISRLIVLTALKCNLIFSSLPSELLNIFSGLRSGWYCWSEFLSGFSLMVSVRLCRMYIMYVFLSRRCVRYVKASCHAIVLCSALSHDWERLSGRVGLGPHLFLLTHVYLSNREQCNDSL